MITICNLEGDMAYLVINKYTEFDKECPLKTMPYHLAT